MNFDIKSLSFSKTIIKPWGKEIIYTPDNSKYTLKKIKIKDGCRLSLQSHTDKTETFILYSGQADLIVGSDVDHLQTISLEQNQSYNIPIGTVHRLVGVKNAIILEASTPETGTTIRYQDDYQRPDETDKLRSENNRGWIPNK